MLGFLKKLFFPEYHFKYEVDASRPPIFPPNRQYSNFGETRESKARRKAYTEYLKKYDEALEKGDFTPVVQDVIDRKLPKVDEAPPVETPKDELKDTSSKRVEELKKRCNIKEGKVLVTATPREKRYLDMISRIDKESNQTNIQVCGRFGNCPECEDDVYAGIEESKELLNELYPPLDLTCDLGYIPIACEGECMGKGDCHVAVGWQQNINNRHKPLKSKKKKNKNPWVKKTKN